MVRKEMSRDVYLSFEGIIIIIRFVIGSLLNESASAIQSGIEVAFVSAVFGSMEKLSWKVSLIQRSGLSEILKPQLNETPVLFSFDLSTVSH
ncbi:unnamed protein product [Ilex paraguariensis]|uniref:Uncharacterized protein n=1 Tax=Ilex paraguariensis TaxID=185542 RepID=A0ABC8TVC0_9AQUA